MCQCGNVPMCIHQIRHKTKSLLLWHLRSLRSSGVGFYYLKKGGARWWVVHWVERKRSKMFLRTSKNLFLLKAKKTSLYHHANCFEVEKRGRGTWTSHRAPGVHFPPTTCCTVVQWYRGTGVHFPPTCNPRPAVRLGPDSKIVQECMLRYNGVWFKTNLIHPYYIHL